MQHSALYDPIRKKDVPDTPEERVRQATIQFLLNEIKVPAHLIAVEFALEQAVAPGGMQGSRRIHLARIAGAAQQVSPGIIAEVRDARSGRCDCLFRPGCRIGPFPENRLLAGLYVAILL